MLSCFSRVPLCDTMDCSLPVSSVHGILQARRLGWIPFPTRWDLPNPGIELSPLMSPTLAGIFLTTSATWEIRPPANEIITGWCFDENIPQSFPKAPQLSLLSSHYIPSEPRTLSRTQVFHSRILWWSLTLIPFS